VGSRLVAGLAEVSLAGLHARHGDAATALGYFQQVIPQWRQAGAWTPQWVTIRTLIDLLTRVGACRDAVTAAWPHMVAQRYGKIILTTSYAGLFGIRGQATYAAAKSAVVGLMRILATEGAEHGILVNTISPVGYTRMHPAAGSRVSEAEGKAATPVEAVAPAIVWLASDGCSETSRIYHVEAGAIQRIAIVMGPGFYDPIHI
jgi:NAD(P)-dependent dehydrogenase (short-subunit alcohol dehydrogenase family)